MLFCHLFICFYLNQYMFPFYVCAIMLNCTKHVDQIIDIFQFLRHFGHIEFYRSVIVPYKLQTKTAIMPYLTLMINSKKEIQHQIRKLK